MQGPDNSKIPGRQYFLQVHTSQKRGGLLLPFFILKACPRIQTGITTLIFILHPEMTAVTILTIHFNLKGKNWGHVVIWLICKYQSKGLRILNCAPYSIFVTRKSIDVKNVGFYLKNCDIKKRNHEFSNPSIHEFKVLKTREPFKTPF